jgi:hypothetical protein
MGGLGPFVARSLGASAELGAHCNLAPSRLLGAGWVLIGLPLAVRLFARGRVGLATIALQPHWIPNYLLIGLLDLRLARNVCRPTAAH